MSRSWYVAMHQIAAAGGPRIKARTPADKRQTKTVDAWRREL